MISGMIYHVISITYYYYYYYESKDYSDTLH